MGKRKRKSTKGKPYVFTKARKVALKKAQRASAAKRRKRR